jgi:hypothetical protein
MGRGSVAGPESSRPSSDQIGRDDVLRARINREKIGAGCRIKRIEHAHLADIHHDLAVAAIDLDGRQRPFERPVEIPLVVGDMLVVPLQLSRV